MCVCCLYFGMLFSDWGDAQTMVADTKLRFKDSPGIVPTIVATNQAYYQNSAFVVVVKFINLMIATGFLIVSMALPVCCPDRIL